MTTDDPQLRDLLDEAASLSPDRRHDFLASACADNPDLLTRLQSLLDELDRATEFLVDPTIPPTRFGAEHSALGTPCTIDRYQLLEPLGEGGMGTVYRARQLSPVRRDVALKLIKPGMDTRQVIARFEAERQALALMDHLSIARVLDAGATETGRPFFVMELVPGSPLTDYCDEHKLPVRDRLALFTQVCRAIQHAHQKGIIHRDLKPSNVLVTMHDDKAVPKVIDFGIAKAISPEPADPGQTRLTECSHPLGTPMYMSPEQLDDSAPNIDTRCDIYSLGVLLYELLTGVPPFDPQRLDRAPRHKLRDIISTEAPPRPSARLRALSIQDAAEIASLRTTSPKTLRATLHGDLDWIILRCLEKDRDRRYESASALARDIERHLHDQPVEARPPSNLYLARKFIQRHRQALAAATVITVLLGVATTASIASFWQSLRASRAEAERLTQQRRADSESQRRLAEMQRADQFAQVVRQIIHSAQPTNGSTGQDLHVTDLLKNASLAATVYLRTLPETEIEVRLELATAFADADDPDNAKENLLRAYHLATAGEGESSKKATQVAAELAYFDPDLPFARRTYANAQHLFGPDSEITHRAAFSLVHVLSQPAPDDSAASVPVSPGPGVPASSLGEAEQISRHLVEQIMELPPAKCRPEHFLYMTQLAQLLNADHRHAEAAEIVQHALDRSLKTGQLRNSTHAALNLTLIHALRGQGHLHEALDQARKSLNFARATIGSNNPTTGQTLREYQELLSLDPTANRIAPPEKHD